LIVDYIFLSITPPRHLGEGRSKRDRPHGGWRLFLKAIIKSMIHTKKQTHSAGPGIIYSPYSAFVSFGQHWIQTNDNLDLTMIYNDEVNLEKFLSETTLS
jgi:hypothetical protein